MSEPRRITVDSWGNIYPVVGMIDRYARDTHDPALAVSCVIDLGKRFHSALVEDIPIYTVH